MPRPIAVLHDVEVVVSASGPMPIVAEAYLDRLVDANTLPIRAIKLARLPLYAPSRWSTCASPAWRDSEKQRKYALRSDSPWCRSSSAARSAVTGGRTWTRFPLASTASKSTSLA